MRNFILENLQYHVLSNRIFLLNGVQQTFVKADGASLALDVLLENRLDEWIIRSVIAAAGDLVPLLRLRYRGTSQLNNPRGHHVRVAEFIRGMLQ
jgi:hypothetical protein